MKKYWERNVLSAASAVALLALATPASAQDAGSGQPVNADPTAINPKVAEGEIPKPLAASGFSGPLAKLAAPLAENGLTFHALALNLFEANPSVGISTANSTNSLYVYAGADLDLGKFAGLQGISLHFENVFFPLTRNLNIAPQIGDSKLGYEPAFTPRGTRLSRLTIEGKSSDGKLDVEAGITHPAYYYAQFNCGVIASCFQDTLFINSGYESYSFAVPGGNISYKITPTLYAQAGVFAVEPGANFRSGYNFPNTPYSGALFMGEVGAKKSFANKAYPYDASVTVYYNTSRHNEVLPATPFNGITRSIKATSGVVLQADKVVWRADGGADTNSKAPTALKLYSSIGISTDRTTPIQSDMYAGATLLSPIAGRSDSIGFQIDWERMSSNFTRYLTAANGAAGGPGSLSPYRRSTFVFQGQGHIQLPLGVAVEPVVAYAVHPNAYYDPTSPVKAKNGVYVAANLVIPIGTILGMSAAN